MLIRAVIRARRHERKEKMGPEPQVYGICIKGMFLIHEGSDYKAARFVYAQHQTRLYLITGEYPS